MKHLLFLFLATFSLISCRNNPSNSDSQLPEVPTDMGGSQDDPDLVAINDAIHGFYAWYEANVARLTINFVKSGKPATLDNAKLDAYFAQLKQSGFISQAYVDNETAYLKNLEATVWKNEDNNEAPLSGLDYDRLMCAQDGDYNFWKNAPVAADGLGTNKASATMSGDEGGSPREQKFEMVKENGKWLIAKIICE